MLKNTCNTFMVLKITSGLLIKTVDLYSEKEWTLRTRKVINGWSLMKKRNGLTSLETTEDIMYLVSMKTILSGSEKELRTLPIQDATGVKSTESYNKLD